jgi:ArsR family transcriptional regulator
MSMDPREAQLVRVAKALGDPTRLRILRAIAAGEISCQELTEAVGISQATVSHHLKVLSEAGLVSARKGGAFHYYRVEPGALAEHAASLASVLRTGPPGADRARRAPARGDR